MTTDYSTYLNPNYNQSKAAAWDSRYAGVGGVGQNPYGRTLSMPTNTITSMIRTLGGFQTPALTAAEELRYSGFKNPAKLGPTHCFNAVDYNPDARLARYQFSNGLRNYYKQMGPIQAKRWADSPSLGQYYNANIRMRMNNTPLGRLFYKR